MDTKIDAYIVNNATLEQYTSAVAYGAHGKMLTRRGAIVWRITSAPRNEARSPTLVFFDTYCVSLWHNGESLGLGDSSSQDF